MVFAAAEEAVFITRYASHVTILIRGDDFTCAKETADETRANPNITVLTNTEVVAVEGDSVLRKITYKNNKTGEETVYSPRKWRYLWRVCFRWVTNHQQNWLKI